MSSTGLPIGDQARLEQIQLAARQLFRNEGAMVARGVASNTGYLLIWQTLGLKIIHSGELCQP